MDTEIDHTTTFVVWGVDGFALGFGAVERGGAGFTHVYGTVDQGVGKQIRRSGGGGRRPEQDPARWASATVEHKWCGVRLRRGRGSGLLDNVFSDTTTAGQEAVVARWDGGARPLSGEMLRFGG